MKYIQSLFWDRSFYPFVVKRPQSIYATSWFSLPHFGLTSFAWLRSITLNPSFWKEQNSCCPSSWFTPNLSGMPLRRKKGRVSLNYEHPDTLCYHSGHRAPPTLETVVVFLCTSRQIARWYLRAGHDRSLLQIFMFICWMTRSLTTDSVDTYIKRKHVNISRYFPKHCLENDCRKNIKKDA